jgi:DNA-binding NarL/FixJ family response regulator
MWTSFEYDDAVIEAMSFGATGFVLKSAGAPAVLDSIRAVSWGMTVIAPDPLKNWKAASTKPRPRETPDLSERERGVLVGLGHGLSNAEIARDLTVSESTVKADLAVLMDKFDAHNRVKLVLRAAEHGLLSG